MNNVGNIRIDQLMVEKELAETRNKAVWMLEKGWVWVNGKQVMQKSFKVSNTDAIEVRPDRRIYVSQGGYKLEKAILEFNLDFKDATVLDIGASTGGFTDCALQHGASQVLSIDIGEGQLHSSLVKNNRVVSLEKTDIRTVDVAELPIQKFDFIVVDVSFMSLEFVFPYLPGFLKPGSKIVALLKPQFEQTERRKHKHGIIKSEKLRLGSITKVQEHILNHGFEVEAMTQTDADGKEKNIEYILLLKYGQ